MKTINKGSVFQILHGDQKHTSCILFKQKNYIPIEPPVSRFIMGLFLQMKSEDVNKWLLIKV